ncbi:chromatin target of PRMT1 protein isoform X2 [Passer montanus]|uniref:chromatin target of PRMT1 protein isoform X2 n=1 Tax=Passer montanus TaxID=9160 RepID=UPI001962045A|nr:chromatin target of PRMT1 protein isoform X2 [Passer montanus]
MILKMRYLGGTGSKCHFVPQLSDTLSFPGCRWGCRVLAVDVSSLFFQRKGSSRGPSASPHSPQNPTLPREPLLWCFSPEEQRGQLPCWQIGNAGLDSRHNPSTRNTSCCVPAVSPIPDCCMTPVPPKSSLPEELEATPRQEQHPGAAGPAGGDAGPRSPGGPRAGPGPAGAAPGGPAGPRRPRHDPRRGGAPRSRPAARRERDCPPDGPAEGRHQGPRRPGKRRPGPGRHGPGRDRRQRARHGRARPGRLRRARQRPGPRQRLGAPRAHQGAAGQPAGRLHVQDQGTPGRRAGRVHGTDGSRGHRLRGRDCRGELVPSGAPDGKFRLSVFFDVLILSVVLNFFWIVLFRGAFWWFFPEETRMGWICCGGSAGGSARGAPLPGGPALCVPLELWLGFGMSLLGFGIGLLSFQMVC